MTLKMQKLILSIITSLILISCGGGGGGSSSSTGPIVSGLSFPVRAGELDSKNLIIAELTTGRVFIFNRETAESTDLLTLAPFSGSGLGISGLLVDRDFGGNGYVFIYHGTGESGRNVLTRIEIKDNKVAKRLQLQLLTPPSGHNGGGMYQLSNGDILLGIGDGGNPSYSQDLTKLEGKILIFNRDGQFIETNSGLPKGIYALGFRNPFGISGKGNDHLFIADNGPDCDDEVNKLSLGGNYGWRKNYECGKHLAGHLAPIYSWSPSQGLTDILFVDTGSFQNTLVISHYNTNTLTSLPLNDELSAVTGEIELIKNGTDPIIDLLETENRTILYTTPTTVEIFQ